MTTGKLCKWNLFFLKEPYYTIPGNDLISSLDAKERRHNKQRPYRTSLFHRGSVPHQDQVRTVPTVNKKGKLFGKELSSICKDGLWPTAILVGLTWFNSGFPKEKYKKYSVAWSFRVNIRVGFLQVKTESPNQFAVLLVHAIPCAALVHSIDLLLMSQ